MTSGNATPLTSMKTGDLIKKISYQMILLMIVIQISLAASWGWAWLLFLNPNIKNDFLKVSTVVGSAILTGFISRTFLKDHLRFTRWLCSVVSLIFSLVGLYYLSNKQVGFTLSLIDKTKTNLDGIFQICLGGIISWLVLNAWKKHNNNKTETGSSEKPFSITTDIAPSNHFVLEKIQNPSGNNSGSAPASSRKIRTHVRRIANPNSSPSNNQLAREITGFVSYFNNISLWIKDRISRKSIPSNIDLGVKHFRKITKTPSRKKHLNTQRTNITLVGMEEHKCPYCLETVDGNREVVVECPVCHTIHHKSCWEITGTCQVPHIHS